MTGIIDSGSPPLVGRMKELSRLGDALQQVRSGRQRTVLVTGDAGIGKTALIYEAIAGLPGDVIVLSGAALPLHSIEIPYQPLRAAFRGTAGIRTPEPFSEDSAAGHPASTPLFLDQWLSAVTAAHPVLLAIDDLHWADQGTLDTLMFLIAGPSDRRLGLVATVRADAVTEGSLLEGWLADVRRIPGVSIERLGPLDRPATSALIASLLGREPHQSLITEVYGRANGNPYFTKLLVEPLDPAASSLPPGLPPDLRTAVLRSWRALPQSARRVTQVLAVGGKNAPVEVFTVVVKRALPGEDALSVLLTASTAGILDRQPDGSYWFHHPLIAETLASETPPEDRIQWHRLFAEAYSTVPGSGELHHRAAADLAQHFYGSGNYEEAYRWALEAARQESASRDWNKALAQYHRVLELRPKVVAAGEWLDLWQEVRRSAFNAGAFEAELDAIEALLRLLNERLQPLEVAALIIRRMHLRMSLGLSFLDPAEAERAVQLSSVEPDSWQHALAMAELVHAKLWMDQYKGSPDCAKVVEAARKTGHHRALSFALTASAMAAVFSGDSGAAREAAREGASEAALAQDFWAFCHALAWLANATEGWISEQYGAIMSSGREELSRLGAPHSFMSKVAADEAASFLAIGAWEKARTALRTAISFDPGPMGDVSARLTLARLDALQGRTNDALAHLARAEEVNRESDAFVNLNFAAIRSELNIMAGNPKAGFETAVAAASRAGHAPTMCEWLLPLAMRAAADMIMQARDTGGPLSGLEAAVGDVRKRFPAALHEPGQATPLYQRQIKAFDMLYTAETGRALADKRNDAMWIAAADACKEANLAWEEAYACQRAGEAMLFHTHHGQTNAAGILRRGLELATTLQAAPVRTAILGLADHGRIRLDAEPPTTRRNTGPFPGLTTRETDVLEQLIAGSTYKEIAADLFISEKTVSTHVSHLLRKTGSTNRRDLARKASGRRRED
ncbi:helix-turn-helix transcriptional regulator [Paenarthrobacter ureafaciens]|uniref:helix-turn-helix transcriptional regulator n=1 Tax=Paenarthrobacter ureafaciens TaxID=37931 RepID=UPI0009AD5ACF|nr:AAA family ATPase [Paenarthrobacter ureafaciens]GLU60200.1 hypothetical protein Pure01_27130 [Paenarthrobacter ureafaciens]GLU64383.1 hypothetical protein Pure02_26330 [Paenarthrobacter ureafaciens]GLU68747.1 hypothetical protein Pure03_27230 [Paenarthrobacter ureafaciens]GLU72918.1 hypothetical protein Pure04_26330 [Paenarthrobacter ureafaciens]GLU77271.1 hypothetical protein Pure05_27110 [Paenarthrobacter ureafaciens]